MSGPAESNGHAQPPEDGAGVLGNLPRTRPQRATPRRAAARDQNARRGSRNGTAGEQPSAAPASSATKPKPKPKTTAKAKAREKAAAKPKRKAAAKPAVTAKPRPRAAAKPKERPLKAVREEVPRQGFESEDERATGSVPPPGGTELLGTAVEIVGELTRAGISGGERVLRDVLSRLGR